MNQEDIEREALALNRRKYSRTLTAKKIADFGCLVAASSLVAAINLTVEEIHEKAQEFRRLAASGKRMW